MKRIAKIINILVGVGLIGAAGTFCVYWFVFRVYVPEDKCLVLIRKTGDRPAGQVIAKPGEKGIQEEALGPGRYFFNPLVWDTELKPLVTIDAGEPGTWKWLHTMEYLDQPGTARPAKKITSGKLPSVGLVKRLVGPPDPDGREVVADGYKGIQEKVLTPGTYRLNPYVFKVETHPATVVPLGFVGVVTSNVGDDPGLQSEKVVTTQTGVGTSSRPVMVRKLAEKGQRGILGDVLQPGIYYLNPIQYTVNLIEVGYNEISQIRRSQQVNDRITFPSSDGFAISVGVTVIWGREPANAPKIVNEFGSVQNVLDRVILPQLRSICRLSGSTYQAKDFIEGEKREEFQQAMTERLRDVCRQKNIEILLALVRAIEVTAAGEKEGIDIKKTIQARYIADEEEITRKEERNAAVVNAQLEQAKKKVDISREEVSAETRKLVADVHAEGEKEAAEIDAERDLKVAEIEQKVALLDAERTRILGKANADVTRLSEQAEADGYKMLVDALGGGTAYNLYTFAQEFQPKDVRLIFAGEGTFWTDLKRFEEAGAAKLLMPKKPERPRVPPRRPTSDRPTKKSPPKQPK